MNFTTNTLDALLNKYVGKKYDELESLNLNNMSITFFSLNELKFTNLEYLSLQNNHLKNTNFLKHFPNLWYLDIRYNQIENYEGLLKHNNFGYLALSLDYYNSHEFLKIKKLRVAILILEGIDENDDRIDVFLYSAENVVLKLNRKIFILDYDKKFVNVESFFYNDNPIPLIRKISSHHRVNFAYLNPINKIITDKPLSTKKFNFQYYLDDLHKNAKEIFNEILQERLNKNVSSPAKIANPRHDTLKLETAKKLLTKETFNSLNREFNYRKAKHSHTIKMFHQKFEINDVDFKENEEFLNLERKKIIYLSQINIAILDLQRGLQEQENSKNLDNYSQNFLVPFESFIIDDVHYLSIIMDILILYILGVLHKEISQKLLKKVLTKIYNNQTSSLNFSFDLKKVFNIEACFLLGIYFKLNDYLLGLVNDYQNGNFYSDYKMNRIIPHLNNLEKTKEKSYKIFTKKSENIFESRKLEIKNTLLKFYEDSKIFESVVKITQHLYDFIQFNKMENELLLKNFNQYKIFLEIRNTFFSYLDKKLEANPVFETLSDRIHNQFKSEILTNEVFFKHQDAKKNMSPTMNDIKKLKIKKSENRLKFQFDHKNFKNVNPSIQKELKNEENIFISQFYSDTENSLTSKKFSSETLPGIKDSKMKIRLSKNKNNLNELKLETEYKVTSSPKIKVKKSTNKEFLKLMDCFTNNSIQKEKKFLSDKHLELEKLKNFNFQKFNQSREMNTVETSLSKSKKNILAITCDLELSNEYSKNFQKRENRQSGFFKRFFKRKLQINNTVLARKVNEYIIN